MTAELDVVIPVRDVDRYLGEALASVRAQAGVECAVVVVDAGSIDPISLPDPFRDDPAVRLVRSEAPLTSGGGRNLGVELGSAPWISFLDADDVWPVESRRALIDACRASGAEIAVGTMLTFHSDDASKSLRAAAETGRANMAAGIVASRACWNRVGPFDPSLRVGEFVDWMLRARHARIPTTTIQDLVLERRIHLESTSARQIDDRDDYLSVVRRWMKLTD